MNRYASYKDSGVEWIGEIPRHWETKKMKYGVELIIEKGIPLSGDIKISPENIESDTGKCLNLYSDYSGEGMKFQEGDILLNKLRLYLKKIIFSDFCGFSMGEMIVLRCKHNLLNKYFYYTLFNQGLIDFLDNQSTGVKLPRVSPDIIVNSNIVFPPLPEQQQIVQFLDTKTELIDTLIEKTQRKIELLKEKRTSLINHTVTKGLNPDVEMKDSGVEWIGEIPSHWEIKKIGYVSRLITGNPWKSDLFNFENGIKIVRGENVSEGFLRWGSRTRYWVEQVDVDSIFYLNEGDIIIGMDGSKVGKNYVRIKDEDLPLLLHQRMCRIRVNEGYDSIFVKYWISSDMFRFYIDISKTDPMIPHITQKNIFDFQIPFPSISEQLQIVEFLDEQTSIIDTTISKEERRIELLKEFRQSLISEVVTGKIKVATDE